MQFGKAVEDSFHETKEKISAPMAVLRCGMYHVFGRKWRNGDAMPDQNKLMLIIGALAVVVFVLGYMLYEARKEPTGVQINVGKDGIKIEQK
jgi:uncharacterized membrane protein YbaN (DUF454 family)